ncbi:unnamed protein product [Protopolystoma xenopodis]|uniref:Uncharacterized protein n=1 Tax=Protopolystoma xenopodis TaxID=117903 RepID=A0A3S5CV67_9PLAT|nr:unnamed protein product [Protopolystoma xenopodis]
MPPCNTQPLSLSLSIYLTYTHTHSYLHTYIHVHTETACGSGHSFANCAEVRPVLHLNDPLAAVGRPSYRIRESSRRINRPSPSPSHESDWPSEGVPGFPPDNAHLPSGVTGCGGGVEVGRGLIQPDVGGYDFTSLFSAPLPAASPIRITSSTPYGPSIRSRGFPSLGRARMFFYTLLPRMDDLRLGQSGQAKCVRSGPASGRSNPSSCRHHPSRQREARFLCLFSLHSRLSRTKPFFHTN